MTAFSIPAFRDFCAAKPKDEVYGFIADGLPNPIDAFDMDADDCDHGYLAAEDVVFLKPRTYGALTIRLNELIVAMEATP